MVGVGGVGGGRDVAHDTRLVRPDNAGAGFDGHIRRDKTRGNEKDGNFLAFFLFLYCSGDAGGINLAR